MDLSSLIQRYNIPLPRHVNRHFGLYTALAAPAIALAVNLLFSNLSATTSSILLAPRRRIQAASTSPTTIPYPEDALPGARDISTPYGSVRTYEFGPTTGRKVLLIHGISTPCISLASLAHALVEKEGCRVLLFDLYGRGYSDTPDPKVWRQDAGLFCSQIMFVLSSSVEVKWLGGGEKFTVLGYSLGGGIGMVFTETFPNLVEGLILVAPSGLLRAKHFSRVSRLVYSGWLPPSLVEWYVGRRLRGGASKAPSARTGNPEATTGPDDEDEVPEHPALAADSSASMLKGRPNISPARAVGWQVEAHPGFIAAFVSSIRFAPISGQHERWRVVGRRQGEDGEGRLREGKVLMLLGKEDAVIVADEAEEDGVAMLGVESVKVVRLAGGHDLPIVNVEGCVDAISLFWQQGKMWEDPRQDRVEMSAAS